jgi:hypothetical protein
MGVIMIVWLSASAAFILGMVVSGLFSLIKVPLKDGGECVWSRYDEDGDTWQGSCGIAWTMIDDGTPRENEMVYCPKCGKRIVEPDPEEADAGDIEPARNDCTGCLYNYPNHVYTPCHRCARVCPPNFNDCKDCYKPADPEATP